MNILVSISMGRTFDPAGDRDAILENIAWNRLQKEGLWSDWDGCIWLVQNWLWSDVNILFLRRIQVATICSFCNLDFYVNAFLNYDSTVEKLSIGMLFICFTFVVVVENGFLCGECWIFILVLSARLQQMYGFRLQDFFICATVTPFVSFEYCIILMLRSLEMVLEIVRM